MKEFFTALMFRRTIFGPCYDSFDVTFSHSRPFFIIIINNLVQVSDVEHVIVIFSRAYGAIEVTIERSITCLCPSAILKVSSAEVIEKEENSH